MKYIISGHNLPDLEIEGKDFSEALEKAIQVNDWYYAGYALDGEEAFTEEEMKLITKAEAIFDQTGSVALVAGNFLDWQGKPQRYIAKERFCIRNHFHTVKTILSADDEVTSVEAIA
jgi:hypothetical protein